MDNKNHTKAKVLTLITLVIFAVSAIWLGYLTIGYLQTGSDVTAIALIFFGSMTLICTTIPCLAMAVAGTIFASKAKKEGHEESKKFFVLGLIEIVIYGFGAVGAVPAALFTLLASYR